MDVLYRKDETSDLLYLKTYEVRNNLKKFICIFRGDFLVKIPFSQDSLERPLFDVKISLRYFP